MLKKIGQVMLAVAFTVSLSSSLAAQNYQLITSEADFISQMTGRTIAQLHASASNQNIYYSDGRTTGSYAGDTFIGNWTWDETGICFTGRIVGKWTVDPGCAEISISGTTAKFSWRDSKEEFFSIGN